MTFDTGNSYPKQNVQEIMARTAHVINASQVFMIKMRNDAMHLILRWSCSFLSVGQRGGPEFFEVQRGGTKIFPLKIVCTFGAITS